MHLHSLTGDLVERAPEICHMMVLWLHGAEQPLTWAVLRERYPNMELQAPALDVETPWWNPGGATFKLHLANGRLRYIHVMPNLHDAEGCPSVESLGRAVGAALDAAVRIGHPGVSSVAFSLIPVSDGGQGPGIGNDEQSAIAMIGALGAWDASHPEKLTHAYLVDRDGRFRPYVRNADEGTLPVGGPPLPE